MIQNQNTTTLEPTHSYSHLLCWRTTVAGILISLMAYMLLSALGIGVVGLASQSAIENETGGLVLATGAGVWMGLSAVISLFAGSYFAVRMSKNITNKVGIAQGLVVASSFFIILTVLASSAVGSLSMGLGNIISGMGKTVTTVGASPRVQDTINNVMGSTAHFKSDPAIVAEGLTVRLAQGDVESAKSYYAYQTGQTKAQVSAKIEQLKLQFDRTAKDVGEKAAAFLGGTGLSLFFVFLVGFVSAGIGGRIAAHSNAERPLTVEGAFEEPVTITRAQIFANQHGSAFPYILAWLLGVPASLLILIAMFRAAF